MADATTSEGLSNLSAHLKEMNSDQAKGREWSNKMMQKGDTKQIMWARRTALGVERIQAMLKAWFTDMAKNNTKMMEAMLEAGRKKEGAGPKKSDTKFGVGGIGMALLGTLGALAAWGTKLQSVLNILYAGKWFAMFAGFTKYLGRLGRWVKGIPNRLFGPLVRIFDAIGEIWKKRGTMQFLTNKSLNTLGKFVRPIEKLFLWIARAEKWIKGWKIWTMFAPAQKGIGAVGGFFARMGNWFKGIMKFLDPVIKFFRSTGRVVGNGFKAIGSFFAGIAKFLKPIASILVKALPFLKGIPVIGWVITAIMGFFDYIKGFIAGWTGADADAGFFEKLLAGLWGGMKGFVTGLIAKPLDLLKDGVSWILEQMGFDKMSAALDAFSFEKLFGDLFGWIEGTFKKIADWFALLFTDPAAAVKNLMPQWILDFGTWLKTKLWDPITTAWDELMADPKGALMSLIPQWMKDFGTWAYNKVIKPVTDWFDETFGDGGEGEAGWKTTLKKQWDKLKNFGQFVYDKTIKPVVDWVNNLFGKKDEKKPKGGGGGLFEGMKNWKLPSMSELISSVMDRVSQSISYIGDLAMKNLPTTWSINKKIASVFYGAADYVKGLGASSDSGDGGGGSSDVSGSPTGSGTGGAVEATEGGGDVAKVVVVGGGGGTSTTTIDASQTTAVNSTAGGGGQKKTQAASIKSNRTK